MKKSALLTVFLLVAFAVPVHAATVKMRMVIVNPSTSKTQTKSIKSYLPKEVTLKDVKDNGGLDIDYDAEQALLYVAKDIELAPGETKTFEIVLDDVWLVPDTKLHALEERTNNVLGKLKDTPYFEQADILAKTILGRLTEILNTQSDPNVTRQQHIAYYRDNLKVLDSVMADIERLEKILVTAGGPPNVELMENSEVNLKSPSTKTTWILIFIILIFISILGGAFYFTWQGQARVTENIFMREKDTAFSEFKAPEKKP
ncbi:MAG TPA: hypothetical protein VL404_00145 [Candidatus Eisenbacteria bacterium]|jgi:flagellar basal body-associated protein FliL|nr:hypothetical protein [Candidatus Eisenbacteria bacterium]